MALTLNRIRSSAPGETVREEEKRTGRGRLAAAIGETETEPEEKEERQSGRDRLTAAIERAEAPETPSAVPASPAEPAEQQGRIRPGWDTADAARASAAQDRREKPFTAAADDLRRLNDAAGVNIDNLREDLTQRAAERDAADSALGQIVEPWNRANATAQNLRSQVAAYETKLRMLQDTMDNSDDPEERRRAQQEARALDLGYQKAQRAAERYESRYNELNTQYQQLAIARNKANRALETGMEQYDTLLSLGDKRAANYEQQAQELRDRYNAAYQSGMPNAWELQRQAENAEARAAAERQNYAEYLAKTKGEGYANRYLQGIEEGNRAKAENASFGEKVLNTVAGLGENFFSGGGGAPWIFMARLMEIPEDALYALTGNEAFNQDAPGKGPRTSQIMQTNDPFRSDAETRKQRAGSLGGMLIDTGYAAGNMLGMTGLAGQVTGALSNTTLMSKLSSIAESSTLATSPAARRGAQMAINALRSPGNLGVSLSSGVSSYSDALANGASFSQAMANGISKAVTEYVSNRLFSGMPLENAPGEKGYVTKAVEFLADKLGKSEALAAFNKTTGGKVLGWIYDKAGEGLEEVVTGLLDPIIDKMTYDKEADWLPKLDQLADEFLGGVMLSLLMSGGEAVLTPSMTRAQIAEDLVRQGVPKAEARKYAGMIYKDMKAAERAQKAVQEAVEAQEAGITEAPANENTPPVPGAVQSAPQTVLQQKVDKYTREGKLSGQDARDIMADPQAMQTLIDAGLITGREMNDSEGRRKVADAAEQYIRNVQAEEQNGPPVPGAVQEAAAETEGTAQETEAIPQAAAENRTETAASPTGRARLEAAMAAEGQAETTAAQVPGEANAEAAGEKVTQRTLASERQKTAGEAGSLRDAGFSTAGEDATARIRSEESWDAEEQAVGQALRDLGYEPTFTVGLIENGEGKSVPFLLEGNKLAVRSDHRSRSVQEIAEKAVGQALNIDQGVRNQVMETITQARAEAKAARQAGIKAAEKPTVSARAQAATESARAAGASEEDGALAGRLADIIGRDIRFFNEAGQNGAWKNGYTQNGVIYINAQAKKPVAWVVGHELTHNVEHSKIYDSLKKLAQKEMGLNWSMRVQSRLDASARIAQKLGDDSVRLTDPADAEREIVADFFADRLLSDEAAIRRVCEYEPVTARNIRDYIKGLLRKLGGKETTLERALTLYNKALKDVAAKAQADAEGRMRLKANPEAQQQESGLRLPGAVQYSTADEVLARTDIDWMDDDSSIKEQLEKHADDLKQMEPVAAVEYNPASANKLVKLMLDEVSRIGGKRMSRNGISFDFDQKGAENIDRHAETDEKRAAALAAPYVAKYGKIIAGQKNHEGTGLTTITIGAPVVINGTTVNEGVVVQFDKNGRPRAINVGLQGGGVFSIKKLETLKGPGSRVYRIGKGTALPTMSASKGTIAETKGKGKRQFSISDTVEETKDLIAIHNLTERNLIDMGELGGAPAPSIAIVKAKAGHTKYGPISLVYSKNTIDPRKNAKNKVYGSDAWTPTAPRIEYEINEKAARSFESKIYELSKKVANGMFGNSGALRQTGVEDDTSLTAEDLAEKLANTDAVRAAYLADNGGNVEVQRKEKVFSQRGNEFLQKIINRFGAQKLAETVSNLIQNDRVSDEDIERLREVYKQDIIDTYPRRLVEKRGPEAIARVADRRASEASSRQLEFFAMEAWEYYEDGGKTKDEIDRLATSNKLQEAARHDDVVNWLMPQLEQVLGKRGIYNGKDPYTASGNRRGFNALHDPYTLENVVKAMSKDDQRGANIWGIGAGTLQSVTTPSYRSIAEIKADSGRLGAVDSEIYDNLKKELDARIESVVQAIFNSTKHYDDNIFSERDNIAQAIIDAARGSRTENSIRQSMQKNGYTVSMKIAAELSSIFDDAAQLPTEYFEAKPMRAVGFDEIVAAVVPDNISARAQKVLDDNGVNTLNYKAGDDADRIEKLNSIPDVQFSAEDSDDEYRQAPGTEALDKLGIRLAGSKGKYHLAEQLLERDKAAKELMKATKKAEQKLKATKAEKEFAAGIAAGIYEERDIPSSMNKDTVATLADYYAAEESFKANMLAEVRGRINAEYQDEAEELLSNVDHFKKISMLMLNERTPDRSFRAMFGPTQGKAIFDWLIRPVQMNEAAKTRWHQEQLDKVRQFKDSKGKTRALTRAESELTMLVMEGKAAAAAVADMEKKGLDAKGIRNAAENIRNGEDAADAAWEFGLKDKERELARNYARWMDTQEKLKNADSTIIENAAEAYSKIFDEFYDGINDFLVAHGYEPIGYIKGYAPHMQPEETQNLLEKAFDKMGISLGNDKAQGLPASIAGETAYFKPNKRWDPYFLHRTGTQAEYDIEKAYQSYVGYLSDILFHTDDIMRVRNMERMIRKTYASDEIKENLDWIQEIRNSPSEERLGMLRDAGKIGKTTILSGSEVNDKLDEWEEEEFNALKEDRQYNNLVMWLSNYANILAGKQSFADRGWEYSLGRNSLNFANRLQAAFQRSLVAGSLTSALNQTAQLPMIKAELGDRWYYAALKDIITGQTRGFWKDSDFLTGKHGVDMLYTDNYDKFISALFKPSTVVDNIVSTTAVRGAFLKAIHQGQSYSEAMRTADDFGRKVMGSREKGTRPLAYESKGLFSRMIHMFQVEAANSWDHIASDLPYEIKEIARTQGKPKAARTLAALLVKALLSTFLLNRLTEETYGGTPAPFDVIGLALNFVASGQGMTTNQYLKTIIDNGLEKIGSDRFFGTEDVDAEFDVGKGLEELGYNVMNDVPLLRNLAGVLGLGDQTVPLPGAGGEFKDTFTAAGDLIKEGANGQTIENLIRAAAKLGAQFVPAGRQLTKTGEGIETVIRGGSYSKKGKLQYPVDSTEDQIRAVLFGKNATNAAQEHWASGENTLTDKQTELVSTMRGWGLSGAEARQVIRDIGGFEADTDPETGKTISGSKKAKVVDYIDGLKLTSDQKDQLYLAQGYAESGLDETPWHAKGGSSGRGKTYAMSGLRLPTPERREPISSGLKLQSTPAAKPSTGGLKLR